MITFSEKLSLILLIAAVFLFFQQSYGSEKPDDVIDSYISCMVKGDYNKAGEYWSEEALAQSRNLEIIYTDVPLKPDCDSPVFTLSDRIRSKEINYSIMGGVNFDNHAVVSISFCSSRDTLRYEYFLKKEDVNWRLSAPHLIFTKDWGIKTSKYTRIHFSNPEVFNRFAEAELDDFIDSLGIKFGIDSLRMIYLSEKKIDYYLCDEAEMEKLTGYKAHGMTKLPFDAVITRHLPHYHELTHLMMNFSKGEIPLYTLPCFQEGLAVYLGGRWGKSPKVLFQMGNLILSNAYVSLEDILTYDGFHTKIGSPDLTYPVSALLVKYIAENFGMECLKTLYRQFSGDQMKVKKFSTADVKQTLETACGLPWYEIEKRVMESAEKCKFSGIEPGFGSGPSAMFIHGLFEDGIDVKIFPGGAQYNYDVYYMDDVEKEGVVLVESCFEKVEDEYRSWMFEEQIKDVEYKGEKYGIHFSTQEVGFYNYFTNVLEAKYVYSFFPDKMYFNAEHRKLLFAIENEFFEGDSLKYRLIVKKR